MEVQINSYMEVPSTNVLLRQAIDEGEAEGFVVFALSQTEGEGRRGNEWKSPMGGLYLSILLRPQLPQSEWGTFAPVAALAVHRALSELVPDRASQLQIKWPNDIIVTADAVSTTARRETAEGRLRKLAGISNEAYQGALCTGIGVNIFHDGKPLDMAGTNQPWYLSDLGFPQGDDMTMDIQKAAEAVLTSVIRMYFEWSAKGFAAFSNEYNKHLALKGKKVIVSDTADGETVLGTCKAIDSHGYLHLDDAEGRDIRIASGSLDLA